jgi:hypothetical protein
MTTNDPTNPRTTREAVDELNAKGGTFCFVCGQGDRTRGGS